MYFLVYIILISHRVEIWTSKVSGWLGYGSPKSPSAFLPDWFHGLTDHLTFYSAQRLDLFAWCVRLSRLLVGYRTHFKSLHLLLLLLLWVHPWFCLQWFYHIRVRDDRQTMQFQGSVKNWSKIANFSFLFNITIPARVLSPKWNFAAKSVQASYHGRTTKSCFVQYTGRFWRLTFKN